MAEPDPAARPRRRAFSAEYKPAMLAEYDAAPEGEKGSILRREGLYSSHVTEWRRARDAGALVALQAGTRKPTRHPAEVELEKLRRRHERTEAELARTRLALDLMGKASALLGRRSRARTPSGRRRSDGQPL